MCIRDRQEHADGGPALDPLDAQMTAQGDQQHQSLAEDGEQRQVGVAGQVLLSLIHISLSWDASRVEPVLQRCWRGRKKVRWFAWAWGRLC